ncbi:MAG TPA: hypothetical protein VFN92_08845 [Solirubrobacterales bacterium]|nr:hypothetical protein [Solirubrobacterales bacterium]
MSKKMTMLAIAVASAAMFALPAVASAGEWVAHNAAGKTFTITKVGANPILESANGDVIECTGLTGTGSYTTTTTGTINLDFTGCKENTFGLSCGTSGTIAVNNKTFHNVNIGNAGEGGTPIGVLITGGSEFVHFNCGGIVTVKVTGNVIGEVESPNCGVAGTTYNLDFKPSAANTYTQKYEQVTTTGTTYDLVSDITIFGGSAGSHTSVQNGTGQIHLSGAVTPTC